MMNVNNNDDNKQYYAKQQNLLIVKRPDLLNEWDYAKNERDGINVDKITTGSGLKAWWRCPAHHHSYRMTVYNKIKGQSCPYCAGAKVLKGFNDLASQRPDVMEEWDWIENDKRNIKPDEIAAHSRIKACWHCNVCKGKYEATVNSKTGSNHNGCPYCAGVKVLPGFNDLASQCHELISSEWNWRRNNKLKIYPDAITKYSNIKAWWKCSECGHELFTSVANRTFLKQGCPDCVKHENHHISQQENQVADYIRNYLCEHHGNISFTMHRSISFKKIYNDKNINVNNNEGIDLQRHMRRELDIYIPELGLAVEYDGDYWHDDERMISKTGLTNDEVHSIKKQLCKQAGIELIFITEHDWLHRDNEIRKNLNRIIDNHIKSVM